MKTIKNPQEHISGLIDCELETLGGFIPHALESDEPFQIHAGSDWQEIKRLTEPEKKAHEKVQAEGAILQELAALDLPPHTLALAISGDSEALDKVIKAEALKVALREELNAIK